MSQEETDAKTIWDSLEVIKSKQSMLRLQAPASCARKTLPEMINYMKARLAEARKFEAKYKGIENDKPNQ